MSTQAVEAQASELRTSPVDVPPVTESYQKAHKNYVLFSALLASWQLIGISLETKEKWGITLKSPNAVPLVLIALVVYFGYKTAIEWAQCDEERKHHPAAALDFRVAHAIATTALAITFIQYLLRIQIFDVISHHVNILSIVITIGTAIWAWKATNVATDAYFERWVKRYELTKFSSTFKVTRFTKIMASGMPILIAAPILLSRDGRFVESIAIVVGIILGIPYPLWSVTNFIKIVHRYNPQIKWGKMDKP